MSSLSNGEMPCFDDGVVRLRRFRVEDRERLVELGDNSNVSRFLANRFPSPYRLEDADAWIGVSTAESRPCSFAIEYEGRLAGGIGLEPMHDMHSGSAELGYWLGEPYWGRGLAVRAVRLMADYAFDQLLFIRLQAMVIDGNAASMRVLEKSGFVREGILRKHVRKNGVVRDAHLFARLRRDG